MRIFTLPNILTLARLFGSWWLIFLPPLTDAFYAVYLICGITDALDGWAARATKSESALGARLDSIADLSLDGIMLIRLLPFLKKKLAGWIWAVTAVILIVRLGAYFSAWIKHRRFASLHTYLNKLTGLLLFFVPFLINQPIIGSYGALVCLVAGAASLEELVIHLRSRAYDPEKKSLFRPGSGGTS